jgi:predicted NBD/HSP70 family sugar kinase
LVDYIELGHSNENLFLNLAMSMPRAVRHINEVRILDSLYRLGTSTRAELARELGLMRSTVGNLIAGLMERGMVLEHEVTGGTPGARAGRPGQHVQLNPHHFAIIGADIGVGHLTVACIDLTGRLIESKTVDFQATDREVGPMLEKLADMIRRAIRRLPAGQVPRGLCVAVPGLVEKDDQTVMRAPVLHWHDVPLSALLKEELKWNDSITLVNDANAFAAAEVYGRIRRTLEEALFVYMDAGIGGGMVSQGRLMRGWNGYAGELGHILLGEHGFDPEAVVKGSFESYAGRYALMARYRQLGGSAKDLDGVVAELRAGQDPARQAAKEWAWWLGRGLASLIAVLNPERVVIGGPLAKLCGAVEAEVVDSVTTHLVRPYPMPPIEVTAFGIDACAIGAAMTVHRNLLSFDERLVFGGEGQSAEAASTESD